jgi:hypothetical protein
MVGASNLAVAAYRRVKASSLLDWVIWLVAIVGVLYKLI